MPIAEADVRWVEEPKLGLLRAALPPGHRRRAADDGRHMFSRKVTTEQYPEERAEAAGRTTAACTGSTATSGPRQVRRLLHVRDRLPGPLHRHRRRPGPADWTDREKYPETFVIDELRCIYCGMCEEACPVDAIELTDALRPDRPEPRADDLRQGEAAERLRPDHGRRADATDPVADPAARPSSASPLD